MKTFNNLSVLFYTSENHVPISKLSMDGYCKLWREFQTIHKPKYWVVWPFSKSKGWCDRITGNL